MPNRLVAALVGGAMLAGTPLAAEDNTATVSAADPQSVAGALKLAGYEAEVSTDAVGDPLITTELNGWPTAIYFYGCDAQEKNNCDSLQFSVGFDRAEAWDAAEAIKMPERYRFAAVRLDEEGDPFVEWDIVTGDGISTGTFLMSVRYFTQSIDNISDEVFAAERAAE